MDDSHEHDTSRVVRRHAGVRGTLLAAGAALGMSLAGLGVAAAQSDEAPPAEPGATRATGQDESEEKPFGRGGRGPGPGRKALRMGGIHGEFTTRAPAGGYQTMATQRGEVTAVSAGSLTVKSEDGFSRTYVVDDRTLVNAGNDGIADVANGDAVHVMAIVEDGGRTRAVDVRDVTQIRASRERWMATR